MDDRPIEGFRYLVTNPDRLGGKPTIRGTRFSVSFILTCLAEGMGYDDIVRDYSEFPRESLAEVLRYAALAEAASRAGFQVLLTRDRGFGESAALAHVAAFEEAWRRRPLVPVAGTIIEWP